MPKLRIETNGNCGPSALSAELIIAFYRGELNDHLKNNNKFRGFVYELCVKNVVNFNAHNVKASLLAFFKKYPQNAQVRLAKFIREEMARLMKEKQIEEQENIFTEFKNQWRLVVKRKQSLSSGKHAFYDMQEKLKKFDSEKALSRAYKAPDIFAKYIKIIKKPEGFVTAKMMVPFMNHLRLNLTVNNDHKYVYGFSAPIIMLRHTGNHFESQRLPDLPNQSITHQSNERNFFNNNAQKQQHAENSLSQLLSTTYGCKKGKAKKIAKELLGISKGTEDTLYGGKEDDEQLEKHRQKAIELQKEEVDEFINSLTPKM
jgi:hypothetical protein